MKSFLLLAAFFTLAAFRPAENADAIVGIWQNSTGKGHIQIFRQNNKYYGKIIWLRDAMDASGQPKLDNKNSDPGQKAKPLLGLVMMRDFSFSGDGWEGGRIYNPGDGREYQGMIRMKDLQTLMVRGYIGISLVGKTDVWTRVR